MWRRRPDEATNDSPLLNMLVAQNYRGRNQQREGLADSREMSLRVLPLHPWWLQRSKGRDNNTQSTW